MSPLRCAFAALLLAAGCAENPVTGRSELVLVSEEQAIASSAVAYREMMAQLEKKSEIESATPRAARVQEIAGQLIAQAARVRPETAKWAWEVKLIDQPKTVNAFAMAGGKIAVYSGMWQTLEASDDELAQVLAHEIVHGHAVGEDGPAGREPSGIPLDPSPENRRQQLQALAAKLEPVYLEAKKSPPP